MTAPSEPVQRYLEHLSDSDLALLGTAAHLAARDGDPDFLRSNPDLIEPALRSPDTFDTLFAPPEPVPERTLIPASSMPSPFLLFAVAVHRAVDDLDGTAFVGERFGGFKRLPVFASAELRALYGDADRRLFTIEHLTSYTQVTSGPVWVRGEGGAYRRVRYSELDPARLAGLLDLVDEDERAGIYRRLGDLALFLTGVFPDHCARTAAHPITVARLARSINAPGGEALSAAEVAPLSGAEGMGGLLAVLGPRWYRLAARRTPLPAVRAALDEAASSFDGIRRFLTVLTDRYLFPVRGQWFGSAA